MQLTTKWFKNPETIYEIIEKYDTPFYLYNEGILVESIERFKTLDYGKLKIHAATMANNNGRLLSILKRENVNVFINSISHYQKAKNSGYEKEEILFASTGVKEKHMKFLIDEGVKINLDSLQQIEAFLKIKKNTSIGVRLNISEFFQGRVSESVNNRIGLLENEIDEAIEMAARYGSKINGIHVYLGSDIINYEYLKSSVDYTFKTAKRLKDLDFVDIGGGFPINGMNDVYFDYDNYNQFLKSKLHDIAEYFRRDIDLIIEPGRALFGDAGLFCTRIIDIKTRNNKKIICVDASSSIFPRSLFYNEFHDCFILNKPLDGPQELCDVVGHTTYSRDYLSKDVQLPEPEIGDVIIFKYAGSYCFSMLTNFLGQEIPKEILIDKEHNIELI